MVDNDLDFQKKVKNSFFQVKEHINLLENKIKENNNQINELKEEIRSLRFFLTNSPLKEIDKSILIQSSTGNEGVRAFEQRSSSDRATGINKIFDPAIGINKIEDLFKKLTIQEFLIFLTVYQIEEDKERVTYTDVSKQLNLSKGYVRAVVSSIIYKGLPLIKQKIDNYYVILSINKDFRDLSLKQKLINIYYQLDQIRKH